MQGSDHRMLKKFMVARPSPLRFVPPRSSVSAVDPAYEEDAADNDNKSSSYRDADFVAFI